jgi:hypothetical protein
MRQDGPGAYEHFTRQAVELTYTVAFKAPTVFLKKAIASIPAVEPYILATAKGGNSYYDVLVNAPEFLRALIYIAEANQPEHLLEGADPVFPVSVSRDAADIIDGYLQTVLGSAAKEHVFFSTNRRRVGETHSQPVQEMLEEAKAGGK